MPDNAAGSHAGWHPERRRLVFVGLGVLTAALMASIAPVDWVTGNGSTRLEYRGDVIVEAPIRVGAADYLFFAGSADGVDFELTYPRGVPVGSPIEATIAFSRNGAAIQPAIGDIVLQLELPDGDSELIPIVRWDEATQKVVAMRRPPQSAAVVLGLLGFVVVLWVTEAIPLFVTSLLIPLVLVFSGVAGAAEATAPFVSPIIILFFAGFLMAEAMKRCGLDHYIAVSITARAGRRPQVLYAVLLGLAAALSMFMSNTAAAVVVIPIAVAVTAPLGEEGYRKALVLGIAYAATIGGVGSAIGTPANQLAIQFLDEFLGQEISFVEWFAFGVPMVVLFLPLMGAYVWRRSHVVLDRQQFHDVNAIAREEMARLGRPSGKQLLVLGVFATVAAGWLTQTVHGYHSGIIALAGAITLFIVGRLEPEDLAKISWPALITFGGGLTLGLFLVQTGVSDYLATRLVGLSNAPALLAVLVVAVITLLLTTVASNTASAAILIPIAIPLAAVIGVSPIGLVVVVAIASSIDFALVVGTPPTMVAYATRLYTAGQIFRKGIVLDFLGLALLVFVVTRIWELLGLT
ncbi:MAG: DASS family sodium-coupled anion symporter [Acidimicrobiia bacterium]